MHTEQPNYMDDQAYKIESWVTSVSVELFKKSYRTIDEIIVLQRVKQLKGANSINTSKDGTFQTLDTWTKPGIKTVFGLKFCLPFGIPIKVTPCLLTLVRLRLLAEYFHTSPRRPADPGQYIN